ncbi:hypothetical protein COX05_02350 [candidate division WWE3 bacterium CG22_combo_CG10-13_8_21_14_all_39_12]|uniref:Uncharacterized protein n=2 Tax=Katanobacteria TaxID=422282 RepID=A0A2M7X409_UNCKA|nr:MAG: hypothetical protein COX05_02350 [candidate division WWE3 bacterium CG22_combo_CG10-13_8_21_14_all_39_12]PJA40915.1 MAG: hypothetical protein CO179_01020 [candidate division WWE3 bacterium CG_4_9_14_3_um_filter_39_7]
MDNQKTLQEILAELNDLESWFKSDEITIDGALANYQKGLELITQAKGYIDEIENQFTQVTQKYESVDGIE